MTEKLTGILAVILLFAACTSGTGDKAQTPGDNPEVEARISDLLSDPLDYDTKTVKIEGVISHVCRHSGDKMRVMEEGSDLSIQVMLGDFTGQFDTESEGMRVSLSGTLVTEVTNIDDLHEHGHDDDDHDCSSTLAAIEAMKARGLDANIRTYIALAGYETK